jgi:hypothetical protein
MDHAKELVKPQRAREVLTGAAELRSAIVDIVAHAERTLAILTPNLEPDLYEHTAFLDTVKRFVLSKTFARIRVLITEPERTLRSGNQFVQMGQRLNTYIQFRNLDPALRPITEAWCIADADSIVYRADSTSGDGVVDSYAPGLAKRYLNRFDELWHSS